MNPLFPPTPGRLVAVLGILCLSLSADWPAFRGSDGSGVSREAAPPTEWGESRNRLWTTPLPGGGASSPIVVGDRVFVTSWTPSSGEAPLRRHLVCLDRESGRILWDKAVDAESNPDRYDGFLQEHGYASSTPACDGERVYVFFGRRGVLAFDLAGRELWQADVGAGSNAKGWGSASSPILVGEVLVVSASEESHAVYGFDRKTGRQLWKAEGAPLSNVFGTPAVASVGGRIEVLVSAPEELWALNPENGRLRWYAQTGLPGNIAPSVVVGEGMAFAFGGFPKLGAVAVTLGGKGEVTSSNRVWSSNNSTYIPTPVYHQGRLHVVSDAGFATCLDAGTGALLYKERLPGAAAAGRGGKPFYAAAVLAGGQVYAVSRRNGVFVFPATPEFRLTARNTLPGDDSDFNAAPAISGGRIYLRSNRYLYCLGTAPARAGER